MTSLEIRHHIPGRIRFKLKALKQYPDIESWLKTSLIAIQGVEEVRVNSAACSLLIHYDIEQIEPANVEQRVEALNLAEAKASESEHHYTRSDVALNLIGSLATVILPKPVSAITTSTLVAPAIIEGAKELSQGRISVEVLDAIALSLSVYRNDFSTAMLTQSLISFGEYMEQETSRHSDKLLADLMQPPKGLVWRVVGREREQVDVSLLASGDLIELAPGDAVPIDGRIEYGTALINQAALTGENVPVRREVSGQVYAGTSVHEGTIQVRVEKVGNEATTAKISKLIFESLSQKSETQQVTQEMANRRVKITLGIGALVFALTRDVNRLASVFLVDYSCALKLSTPVTFKSIMYKSARHGILLKGGSAIEKLVKVDTCIFDKTGTLTHGDMEVTDVIPLCGSNSARDLLAIAASVEEHSSHPLSQAVVSAAKKNALPHIHHGEVEYVIAHGLRSTLKDHPLIMGSRHFLEAHEQVDFSEFESQIEFYQKKGRHLIFISLHQKLIGMIGLRDHLREDVKETLQTLRDSGVKHLVMISGDNRYKAEQLAEELGLDEVYAEATPESKSEIIASLQQQGRKVLFVGDGVNDAPALTKADVGMAMGQGTELARQAADVVLLKDELKGVAEARLMAQQAMKLINSNIKLAEYINSGIMLAAATGKLNPALSALLHNGTTLAILARSMAARR